MRRCIQNYGFFVLIATLTGTLVVAPTPSGLRAAEKLIEPLLPGWERFFQLDWEVVEPGGHPVVRGYVMNDSPYTVTGMRLLLDALNGSGRVAAQQISWIPGTIGAFRRTSRSPCSSARKRTGSASSPMTGWRPVRAKHLSPHGGGLRRGSRTSSSRRSSGSRGTTATACSNRSATCRRPSLRRPTMTVRLLQSAWRFSRNELSGKPGAVQVDVHRAAFLDIGLTGR